MSPPNSDPGYLQAATQSVYAGLALADPDAVWVMQGWLFVSDPSFWQVGVSVCACNCVCLCLHVKYVMFRFICCLF